MKFFRYYVRVSYTFYNPKTKKYGKTLYVDKIYDTEKMARKFIQKTKAKSAENFKNYGGVVKNFKGIIKKI